MKKSSLLVMLKLDNLQFYYKKTQKNSTANSDQVFSYLLQ